MTESKPNAAKPAKPQPAPAVKAEAAKHPEQAAKPVKHEVAQVLKAAKLEPVRAPVAAEKPVVASPAPAKAAQVATPPAPAKPAPVAKAAEPVKKNVTPIETPAATKLAVAIKQGTEDMATKFENEIKKTTETAAAQGQAMFADINDRSKVAMEKGAKTLEDIVEFTKGNVEAIVASSRIAAKGAEKIAREAAEFGRQRLETATTTLKSFASAKSPTEVFQLQSDFARSAFDAMIAENSKFSEAMLKLAGEAFEPIQNRYAVATDKFKQVAA
ncbi:MAG: TIGR01841 family phasin [Sphingomonadaceae bacterium]|nr:TIGR01841 family phasin [Sphingomonadaceae bacterium]